jgi:hypothetical protein
MNEHNEYAGKTNSQICGATWPADYGPLPCDRPRGHPEDHRCYGSQGVIEWRTHVRQLYHELVQAASTYIYWRDRSNTETSLLAADECAAAFAALRRALGYDETVTQDTHEVTERNAPTTTPQMMERKGGDLLCIICRRASTRVMVNGKCGRADCAPRVYE